MKNESLRNYKMDNMKALLIYMVVFGHLLECFGGRGKLFLYYTIYMFHMPAFVYVTGYFSRTNPERLIKKIFYTYAIYQILYLLFQRFYLKQENQIQFTTPYWLLWYLLSLCWWMLLLQIIDWKEFSKKTILGGVGLLALIAGFDKSIGYYMSLSRTIVLLPFFVLGHYRVQEHVKNYRMLIGCTAVIALSECVLWAMIEKMKSSWLYYAAPYGKGGGTVWMRAATLFMAYVWINLLLMVVPDRKMKLISTLGQHTLPVFLIHGFIVKGIARESALCGSEVQNILISIILAGVICIGIGNQWMERMLHCTLSSEGLESGMKRIVQWVKKKY